MCHWYHYHKHKKIPDHIVSGIFNSLMHCRNHTCHTKQQEDHTNDNTVVTKGLEVVIFDVIHHELNRKQRHNPRNHKAK